jgi:hypothetical protein
VGYSWGKQCQLPQALESYCTARSAPSHNCIEHQLVRQHIYILHLPVHQIAVQQLVKQLLCRILASHTGHDYDYLVLSSFALGRSSSVIARSLGFGRCRCYETMSRDFLHCPVIVVSLYILLRTKQPIDICRTEMPETQRVHTVIP